MVDTDRIEATRHRAKHRIERASHMLGDARDEAEERLGQARKAARGQTRAVRRYTENRPLQALAIAALIGFGIGFFASRR